MPLISVIVPVYKSKNTIHCCINSILRQTFSDFELILVDDGSPDECGSICDRYEQVNKKIKVIHKENGGVSSARNSGIEVASGEYIVFIDSDDYIESDYLFKLIQTKNKYKEFDNIWCGFNIIDNDKIDTKDIAVFCNTEDFSMLNVHSLMILHEKWLDPMPWNKLYFRDVIVKNDIKFDTELSLGEDLIFNLNYLDCTNKRIVVINKGLYNYRRDNNESLDNKYYPNLFDIYKLIHSEMLSYSKKWNLTEKDANRILGFAFYKYELALKNTFSSENVISNRKKIRLNNMIMKTKEFQDSFNYVKRDLNFIYKIAYSTNNYIIVRLADLLIKFLKG